MAIAELYPSGLPGPSRSFAAKPAAVVDVLVVDQNNAQTLLLINCEGTDGSQVFVDESIAGGGKTVDAIVSADVDNDVAKFGAGSCRLRGDGSYLSVDPHAHFNFRTGSFTVEMWARIDVADRPYLFAWYLDADNHFGISWENSTGNAIKLALAYRVLGVDQFITNLATVPVALVAAWHHFAIVVTGGQNVRLYIDGVQRAKSVLIGSPTHNVGLSGWPLWIGKAPRQAGTLATVVGTLKGHLDQFRVQAAEVFRVDFTPFTNEYTPQFTKTSRGRLRAEASSSKTGRGSMGVATRAYRRNGRGEMMALASSVKLGRGRVGVLGTRTRTGRGLTWVAVERFRKTSPTSMRVLRSNAKTGRGAAGVIGLSWTKTGRGEAMALASNRKVGRGEVAVSGVRRRTGRGVVTVPVTQDRYVVYINLGSAPDPTVDAPAFTFAASPGLSPVLTGAGVHHVVVQDRNQFNLQSKNHVSDLAVELDGSDNGLVLRPTAPAFQRIAAAAGNKVDVTAEYYRGQDSGRAADEFVIFLTSDGSTPDPDVDAPAATIAMPTDGRLLTRLEWLSPAHNDGDTIKIVVRSKRTSDARSSDNTAVISTMANEDGPTLGTVSGYAPAGGGGVTGGGGYGYS